MSGIETLLPYLDKKRSGESPTIIVDSREAKTASKVVNCLIELGVNVKSAHLKKGDYKKVTTYYQISAQLKGKQ